MAFKRVRTVKGRQYATIEERYRNGGKVKSRVLLNLGPVGGRRSGSARKVADELYRGVLRENVYKFGKARTGERYAREAWAREQYHRRLDEENHGQKQPDQEMRDAMDRVRAATYEFHTAQDRYQTRYGADTRERSYQASHQSPQSRAESEQADRKARAEEELAQARSTASKSSQDERKGPETVQPTAPPASEAPGTNDADRAYDARSMARDAAFEEYTAMANAEDAASDGGKTNS